MWTWVVIIACYSVSLFLFELLGGIGAAGRAIETWGRSASQRRLDRSGSTPESYARARLGGRTR